jgi:hypothetical protein
MILYNYSDCDYSVVKIMANKEDAFAFICREELKTHLQLPFRLTDIRKKEDFEKIEDDIFHVCCILSGNYNKFNLCNHENISSFAIVPMKIE